jgi:hypothetical protein
MKSKSPSSNKNVILGVYLYFFMGVGLIMMTIGAYGLGQNYYKSNLLLKYPLGGYEQRCDYITQPMPLMKEEPINGVNPEEYEAENQRLLEECEARVEEERATRKVTDFYNALITFVIGLILFSGHVAVNMRVSKK